MNIENWSNHLNSHELINASNFGYLLCMSSANLMAADVYRTNNSFLSFYWKLRKITNFACRCCWFICYVSSFFLFRFYSLFRFLSFFLLKFFVLFFRLHYFKFNFCTNTYVETVSLCKLACTANTQNNWINVFFCRF